MGTASALARNWRKNWRRAGGLRSAFTAPVPPVLRDRTLLLQAERLHAFLPLLCLLVAANSVAMSIAVLGDLPWWRQFIPPALIIGSCLYVLVRSRGWQAPTDPEVALDQLHAATRIAATLGLVAGLWSVSAFEETERYYCMVAPVFLGIAAMGSATCLQAAPRAAIAGMLAAVVPIAIKLAAYDNLGLRAMAAMLVLVAMMQAGVVLAKFRETVAMLTFQHRLNRLAATDMLTGLDNRLAFMGLLQERLAAGQELTVLLADLDGFKAANDTNGHQAGDAILVEVGRRMRRLAPEALSVARLGGDELAILFGGGDPVLHDDARALRAAISLPIVWRGSVLSTAASLGLARSPDDGREPGELLHRADLRLYADKAARKASLANRA